MNRIEKYLLKEKCISPRLMGFRVLEKSISLVLKNRDYMLRITSNLYPIVANSLNISKNMVERSIRHALAVANIGMTNKEFIALAVLELK